MVEMNIALAKEYFSKLLNYAIDDSKVIKLTSGQSARAHTWLISNSFNVTGLSLSNGFTLRQLDENQATMRPSSSSISTKSEKLNGSAFEYKIELIGIDIQSIDELFPAGLPADPKEDTELLAIYTLKELSYAQSKPSPLQTLTGIFAAKEAVQKCSRHMRQCAQIEILPDGGGRPCTEGYSLSISHSKDYAVAVATPKKIQFNPNPDVEQWLSNNQTPVQPEPKFIINNVGFRIIVLGMLAILIAAELMRMC